MSSIFLWSGLTVFVAFPALGFGVITLAGLLMVVGLVLLILGK